jgi:hypothetical protein
MITRKSTTAAVATALVAAAVFLSPTPAGSAALDTTPPSGAVGGLGSPASGTLRLLLYASDSGFGLANGEAKLDEQTTFVRLGTGACPEHPSGEEPPAGAECPESVSAVPLAIDTTTVPEGIHRLRVAVTDAAANTATLLDRAIEVRNPLTPTGPSATLTLGLSGGKEGAAPPPSPPGQGQGHCRAPRLRMHLARKPLWRTRPHRVAVLRYGRRYPYRGRLTCLYSGRRIAAPEGTPVGVYYRVWRRSFKRPTGPLRKLQRATLKVRNGRLAIKLAFRSGRTLIFRYRSPEGEPAKAKLRIAIPPRSRRAPWGPR